MSPCGEGTKVGTSCVGSTVGKDAKNSGGGVATNITGAVAILDTWVSCEI